MNIVLRYLDKKSAAVRAIEDFRSMQFILDNTDDEIKSVYDRMSGLENSSPNGMPKSHNPSSSDMKMVSGIETLDLLRERYQQAKEYMAWFYPAWLQLSEDDQYILKTFYSDEDTRTTAVDEISNHFSIERSSVYNKKNRALMRLATLLFGIC